MYVENDGTFTKNNLKNTVQYSHTLRNASFTCRKKLIVFTQWEIGCIFEFFRAFFCLLLLHPLTFPIACFPLKNPVIISKTQMNCSDFHRLYVFLK